jgi:hypothetical protein
LDRIAKAATHLSEHHLGIHIRKIFSIAPDCPLGCGPVILVKRVTDCHVFAWCVSCGLAWNDPSKETWHLGDVGQPELHATGAALGAAIDFANSEDIKRTGLEGLVSELARDKYWCDWVDAYNMKYGCDRQPSSTHS